MLKFLLSRVMLPLLVVALAPSLPPLATAIDQGDVIRWLARAGWTFWIPFVLLVADLLALLGLRGRSRRIRLDTRARLARFWLRWKQGGAGESLVEHDGVLWPVLASSRPDGPPDVRVSPTPVCPVCDARLESHPGRLLHRWTCPSCGFRRTGLHSAGDQAERLLRLAREVRDAPGCAG